MPITFEVVTQFMAPSQRFVALVHDKKGAALNFVDLKCMLIFQPQTPALSTGCHVSALGLR